LAKKVVKKSPVTQRLQNRVGHIWGFVGSLIGVMVAAHGGGGVEGCWGEKVVAARGWKMVENQLEYRAERGAEQGRRTVRLIRGESLDAILRAWLAQLKQSMS